MNSGGTRAKWVLAALAAALVAPSIVTGPAFAAAKAKTIKIGYVNNEGAAFSLPEFRIGGDGRAGLHGFSIQTLAARARTRQASLSRRTDALRARHYPGGDDVRRKARTSFGAAADSKSAVLTNTFEMHGHPARAFSRHCELRPTAQGYHVYLHELGKSIWPRAKGAKPHRRQKTRNNSSASGKRTPPPRARNFDGPILCASPPLRLCVNPHVWDEAFPNVSGDGKHDPVALGLGRRLGG